MADLVPALPAIHVALLAEADPSLERHIGHGAEEVGVPTRVVPADGGDVVAAAYAAARASSFGVGLAVGAGRIALHESHMPPDRAVVDAALGSAAASVARRFGGNAARLVVRLPLRLVDDEEVAPPPAVPANPQAGIAAGRSADEEPTAADIAMIVARVVARMQKRGTAS